MIRLKNKFGGKAALNIMGGPSILENNFDLSLINKDKYVVFLESKALTPRFLRFGLKPDFFLMFFPDKCQSNSLQHVIYQSLLADIDLSDLFKEEYLEYYYHFKNNFEQYFESWSPARSLVKKFRWKRHIKLENSPFSLLQQIPFTSIITRLNVLEEYCDLSELNRPVYFYEYKLTTKDFVLEEYFNPYVENNQIVINNYSRINSAAGALFPLQSYMGFRKIYFIGMDMSMLGSMEYSSIYTFKSMKHYGKFFEKVTPVFNYNFKRNRKKFMRPPYEFDDMKKILSCKKIEFVNVFEPFEFALPVSGVRNINFREFLNE